MRESIPDLPDQFRSAIPAVIWQAMSRAQGDYRAMSVANDISLDFEPLPLTQRPNNSVNRNSAILQLPGEPGGADAVQSPGFILGEDPVLYNTSPSLPTTEHRGILRQSYSPGTVSSDWTSNPPTDPTCFSDSLDAFLDHPEFTPTEPTSQFDHFQTSFPDQFSMLVDQSSTTNSNNSRTENSSSISDLPSSNTQTDDLFEENGSLHHSRNINPKENYAPSEIWLSPEIEQD